MVLTLEKVTLIWVKFLSNETFQKVIKSDNFSKDKDRIKKQGNKKMEKDGQGTTWPNGVYSIKVIVWNVREAGCLNFVSQVWKLSKNIAPDNLFLS